MPGPVPGIHANTVLEGKTWMAGTSPAMTAESISIRGALLRVTG
jgi:hypothetical protein